MNFTCPNCGLENACYELTDEDGSHYSCPDCDHEWVDAEAKKNRFQAKEILFI